MLGLVMRTQPQPVPGGTKKVPGGTEQDQGAWRGLRWGVKQQTRWTREQSGREGGRAPLYCDPIAMRVKEYSRSGSLMLIWVKTNLSFWSAGPERAPEPSALGARIGLREAAGGFLLRGAPTATKRSPSRVSNMATAWRSELRFASLATDSC